MKSSHSYWYMIIHEVAILVKANAKKYADMFTDSPDEKKTLAVIDNSLVYGQKSDWGHTISLFH